MPKSTTITLPEHQFTFLEGQLAEGLYASPSEVVQAGLRLLEEQETRLEQLRAALVEGEQSRPGRLFDEQAFLARMHAEHAARR